MFIVTAKFSRRRVLAAAAVLFLVLALTVLPRACRKADEAPSIPAETNEQRVAYLVSLGWKVNEQPIETLSVTLGDTLEEPYESYNALQLEQGFDLSRCCGKTLLRYTYVVTNYPGASLPCINCAIRRNRNLHALRRVDAADGGANLSLGIPAGGGSCCRPGGFLHLELRNPRGGGTQADGEHHRHGG